MTQYDIEKVLNLMTFIDMPSPHSGETILSHGLHSSKLVPIRLKRAALYHDVGRIQSGNDHPELGAQIAERLGFEQWEVDLIRYHHSLYNLVNLPSQNIRAIKRFLRNHRSRLEDLVYLAHADIFAEITSKTELEWNKIELLLEKMQEIEKQNESEKNE